MDSVARAFCGTGCIFADIKKRYKASFFTIRFKYSINLKI